MAQPTPLRDMLPQPDRPQLPSLPRYSDARPLPPRLPELTPPDERICPVCFGYRWTLADVQPGHKLFGRAQRCPVCGEEQQAQYLAAYSGLTAEQMSINFANSKRPAHQATALQAAREAAQNPQWFWSVFGAPGTGKTHLLLAIVNEARAHGRTAYYITMSKLLDHLRRAYAPDARIAEDALWDKLMRATVLAVDECDRYNPTAWAQSKFFDLVDERWRNGPNRLTCFAGNASPDEMPEYFRSRVIAARSWHTTLSGFDLRSVM